MDEKKNLKTLLNRTGFVTAPGAYDALTARIVESNGFPAVYMTGYGTSVSGFGLPDIGFLTMTEMVWNASRMADAIEIPLIADADTGYGNPMNVTRTIREYEKAGVSAIQLEDQEWPKRCGHMSGKKVVDLDEMTAKIKAAADARKDSDFLIIARTDALAIEGMESAIERAHAYAEAGADILFVEAPRTKAEMEQIPTMLTEKPLLINMAPLTPNCSIDELKDMGFSIAIFPGVCLVASIAACNEDLQRLKTTGFQKDFSELKQSFNDLNNWLKAPYYLELEQKYKSKSDQNT